LITGRAERNRAALPAVIYWRKRRSHVWFVSGRSEIKEGKALAAEAYKHSGAEAAFIRG